MENILNNDNKEFAKKELKKIIEMGIDFKCQEKFAEKIFSKNQIEDILKTPEQGKELVDLINEFKDNILPYCSNFSTTNFMGFPDAGNSIAGLSGAVISDFLQQNLIKKNLRFFFLST